MSIKNRVFLIQLVSTMAIALALWHVLHLIIRDVNRWWNAPIIVVSVFAGTAIKIRLLRRWKAPR